jgi:hypothetical protein
MRSQHGAIYYALEGQGGADHRGGGLGRAFGLACAA